MNNTSNIVIDRYDDDISRENNKLYSNRKKKIYDIWYVIGT